MYVTMMPSSLVLLMIAFMWWWISIVTVNCSLNNRFNYIAQFSYVNFNLSKTTINRFIYLPYQTHNNNNKIALNTDKVGQCLLLLFCIKTNIPFSRALKYKFPLFGLLLTNIICDIRYATTSETSYLNLFIA